MRCPLAVDGHPSQEEVVVDRQGTVVVNKKGSVAVWWKIVQPMDFVPKPELSHDQPQGGNDCPTDSFQIPLRGGLHQSTEDSMLVRICKCGSDVEKKAEYEWYSEGKDDRCE